MNKLKPAFIGFIPEVSMDERFKILKSYADLGYRATEFGDFLLEGDPKENLKRLNEIGLVPLTTILPGNLKDQAALDHVVKKAEMLGISWAALYGGSVANYRFKFRSTQPTYDELMQEIEDLNNAAKFLKAHGIVTTFHNHEVEFQTFFRGKPVFYHMLENSDYLKFELDCGWVLYGHYDPVRVLSDVGDKLHGVHIKDFRYGNALHTMEYEPGRDLNQAQVVMPQFTAVGTGFLPLAEVLEKAASMDVEYAIVEEDFTRNLDNYNSLAVSILNMRETGFVD